MLRQRSRFAGSIPRLAETNWEMWRKWSRWGAIDFHQTGMPQPIIHAVAFDPDCWKRDSLDLVKEAGINLRLHSWLSEVLVEDGRVTGVICQTKLGRQAIRAKMVVDASGDLDWHRPRGPSSCKASISSPPSSGSATWTPTGQRRSSMITRRTTGSSTGRAAADRRGLGDVVAEDAAAGHRLVQLPAHAGL